MNNLTLFYKTVTRAGLFAAAILLIPLIVMQFTSEVDWKIGDFAIAWVLITAAGLTYRLIVRNLNVTYKAAVGLGVTTGLLLVWMNLAVGIVGSENNLFNLLYIGVLLIGIIGAFKVRLRPVGMARTLFAVAAAQVFVAGIVLVSGAVDPVTGWREILTINGFFVLLWSVAAWLFLKAEQVLPPSGIEPVA